MERIIDKVDAIKALYSSAYKVARGDGRVTWKDGHETTAEETTAINAKVIELQAEYDALEYARNRATTYDSVGDQLDQLMKDMRDGTTTHKDACEAVKAKFPKPE